MPPKRTRALPTKAARRAARLRLGPLQRQLIAPNTALRYRAALRLFFRFLFQQHFRMPTTAVALDQCIAKFIESLWHEGDPLSYATDCLSGMQFHLPTTRGKLVYSWRLIKAWKKAEIPTRATPFLPSFVTAVAAYPHFSTSEVIAILVGFHCLLRTGELFRLQWQHFEINPSQTLGVLTLPSTKSGNRFGYVESVSVTEKTLLRFIAKGKQRFPPEALLISDTPCRFRDIFDNAVTHANLLEGLWKPYSLRRGGATQHFRDSGSMDATCLRGRWAHLVTCRIYVNDANATLTELRTTACQQLWHGLLKRRLAYRLRQW